MPSIHKSLVIAVFLCGSALTDARANESAINSWSHRDITVYHFSAKQLPIVDVRLWFAAGSAYSNENSSIAYLTNGIVGRGTKDLSEADLDLQLGLIGARFHKGIDRDGAWLGVRSLSGRAEQALSLLSQIVSQPRWRQDSLKLIREQNRLGIGIAREKESSRLKLESFQQLYGKHPYARPVSGDVADNDKVSLDQLIEFHRQHYTAKNMRVLVVGDIDRGRIDAWLDELLEQIPVGKAQAAPVWVKNTPLPKKLHAPLDSSQVHWNAITLGLVRSHTDYPLMTLALFMLDKRIDKILRDELGLTYSAGAFAHKLIGRGMVRIYFSTRADGVSTAVDASNKIINQFFRQGIDAEELQRAITHLTGLLSISYNSNSAILDLLQIIAQENLPTDYLGRLITRIGETSLEEINEFIHRYFSHRRFSQISVGAQATNRQDAPPDGTP